MCGGGGSKPAPVPNAVLPVASTATADRGATQTDPNVNRRVGGTSDGGGELGGADGGGVASKSVLGG